MYIYVYRMGLLQHRRDRVVVVRRLLPSLNCSLHAYMPIHLHTYIPTFIHTYIHTFILSYIHTYELFVGWLFCRCLWYITYTIY